MPPRVPPGRAGRPWLVHRIDIATRGADVLDQKRAALLREEQRLAETLAMAEAEWHEHAWEASRWLRRAALLGGERPLRIARAHVSEEAHVQLMWRNTLGVLYPEDVQVALPVAEALPPGSTSALTQAVGAHRRALEAAARFGAARIAHELVTAELRRTTRRLRAIERRWLPAHERALAELELALDEREREDSARIRWVIRRLNDSGRDARCHEVAADDVSGVMDRCCHRAVAVD